MTVNSASEPSFTHVFFGGTFDPPHLGHLGMVDACLKTFPEAVLHVVPSGAPAGAFGEHKMPKASFSQRLKMCELTFAHEQRVLVDRIEEAGDGPHYTVDTLEKLRKSHPGSRWALMIGFDQLEGLKGWHAAETLVNGYDIIAVARPGFSTIEQAIEKLSQDFMPLKKVSSVCYQWQGHQLHFLSVPPHEAASRVFRVDPDGKRSWVTQEVMTFIEQNRLYAEE